MRVSAKLMDLDLCLSWLSFKVRAAHVMQLSVLKRVQVGQAEEAGNGDAHTRRERRSNNCRRRQEKQGMTHGEFVLERNSQRRLGSKGDLGEVVSKSQLVNSIPVANKGSYEQNWDRNVLRE